MAAKRVHDVEYHKAYYEANRERILARKKAYAFQLGEKFLAKKREEYAANKIHICQQKKKYRKHAAANIAYLNAGRKKATKQRTPEWLTDFDKLKMRCIYSVAAMLTRYNKEPWHVDHIIPLRGNMVSGLHVPSNLQVMRGVENISKKNKFEALNG
jgi:hypothetical protein